MSFSPDAGDAALLAWANACLQSHTEEFAPTLEAIVDTNSLSIMCKKFHLGDPEQGARKQSAAQRRRRVAEVLNACRIGLVEPSMAELGGPAAARSITAAILLIAVEAPAKEEAIQFIVTLDQAQQAELAQIIQQLMEATGVDAPQRRSSSNLSRRRFSDVQLAGNDPTEVEPLQAEVRELHQELEKYLTGFMAKKQVHSAIASKVAEAKAHLCIEADRSADLLQELDAKESEHRSLSRDLINLKEELKLEGSAASNNSEALKELGSELEEERRRYRTLAMRHIDLKAEVDQAQHSSAQVEASSWKRTAMMAKLHRLQDRVHSDRGRLAESQRIFHAEELCSSSLREELEQAEEVLSHRQAAISACEESVANSEAVLQLAESELDSCTHELKAMSSEDVESLQVEIEKKKNALARAEQGTKDAIAQRATLGKQISEISAVLEDNRIAAERATTEAVAEGVAATKALQRLNANDEASTSAEVAGDGPSQPEAVQASEVEALRMELKQSQDNRIAAERATTEAVAEGVAATKALQRLNANDEASSSAEVAGDGPSQPEAVQASEVEALRMELKQSQERERAAIKLQALERGVLARSRVQRLKDAKGISLATLAQEGHEAKDVSYQRIKQPLAPAKREERERAAIKLQALERGVLARSRAQRLKDAKGISLATLAQEGHEAKASKPQSISERGLFSAKAHRQQGPSVEMLEEQIELRQQELAFKENQASEAEAAHAREVALMASSLHRLGMRYGRLLGQCQALEALVPERVRRMREGNPN